MIAAQGVFLLRDLIYHAILRIVSHFLSRPFAAECLFQVFAPPRTTVGKFLKRLAMITTASGISTPHKKNVANTDRFMPMKPNMSSSDIWFPPGFFIFFGEARKEVLPSPPTCKVETGRPIYGRPVSSAQVSQRGSD